MAAIVDDGGRAVTQNQNQNMIATMPLLTVFKSHFKGLDEFE